MKVSIELDTVWDDFEAVQAVLAKVNDELEAAKQRRDNITTLASPSDVVAARQALQDAAEAADDEVTPKAIATRTQSEGEAPRRRGRPRKVPAPPAPVEPAPPVTVEPAPVEPAPVEPAPPATTAEGALEAVFNTKGAAAAIASLQRFGVMRLRDLAPEQVPDFVAYCQGVLAGNKQPEAGEGVS